MWWIRLFFLVLYLLQETQLTNFQEKTQRKTISFPSPIPCLWLGKILESLGIWLLSNVFIIKRNSESVNACTAGCQISSMNNDVPRKLNVDTKLIDQPIKISINKESGFENSVQKMKELYYFNSTGPFPFHGILLITTIRTKERPLPRLWACGEYGTSMNWYAFTWSKISLANSTYEKANCCLTTGVIIS